MKVLIGCEESQAVCIAFRERGFEAYSCDTQDCSSGHPEWHLKMDVFEAIEKVKPTLLIGHPPCTYLSTVSNRYYNIEIYGNKAIDRWRNRIEALQFFYDLWSCGVKNICLENPQGFLGTAFRKADQIIHPYYFGDAEMKRTHLWLKNLPKLKYTLENNLFFERTATPPPYAIIHKARRENQRQKSLLYGIQFRQRKATLENLSRHSARYGNTMGRLHKTK